MNRHRPYSTLPVAPCQRERNANALEAKLRWKHEQSQQTEMVEDTPCEEIKKEATAPKTRFEKINMIICLMTMLIGQFAFLYLFIDMYHINAPIFYLIITFVYWLLFSVGTYCLYMHFIYLIITSSLFISICFLILSSLK